METNKEILRSTMTARRNSLSKSYIQSASDQIFNRIRHHDIYKYSDCIFSYVSFRSEVDTWNFNKQVLADGKILAIPRVISKKHMEFYRIQDLSQLNKGYMGIYEPDLSCKSMTHTRYTGLMIIPGLAFDRKFGRLGYGGGFYDRYLIKYSKDSYCCGVAFDCQLTEHVPREPHDILMNYIVTETEYLERMNIK